MTMPRTLKDLKPGDTVHVTASWHNKGHPLECPVEKVGRTLIHVKVYGSTRAFELDTGKGRDGGMLIPDLEAHQHEGRRQRAYQFIKQYMRLGSAPETVSLADMQRAAKLLKIDLPPELIA